MKNIKKINFAEVSDKQALSMEQLSKIVGGADMEDACTSNVCAGSATEANTKYCASSGICTNAITTCMKNSETDGNGGSKPTCAIATCISNA